MTCLTFNPLQERLQHLQIPDDRVISTRFTIVPILDKESTIELYDLLSTRSQFVGTGEEVLDGQFLLRLFLIVPPRVHNHFVVLQCIL
jgi:hypothetical protein